MRRTFIDIYCERTGPEFWSEPLNAVTNLAFLLAAGLLVRDLTAPGHPERRRNLAAWFFTGLVFAIGIGSGLFHTLATRWAMLADVVPIAIFILAYTWFALRRFAEAPHWVCALGVMAVLVVAAVVPPLTGFRGGAYVAALLALILIGGYLRFAARFSAPHSPGFDRGHPAAGGLLAAAAVFTVSLTLRTLDQPLCAAFPSGTHFGWHILNAGVLYLVTRCMIRSGPAVRPTV